MAFHREAQDNFNGQLQDGLSVKGRAQERGPMSVSKAIPNSPCKPCPEARPYPASRAHPQPREPERDAEVNEQVAKSGP